MTIATETWSLTPTRRLGALALQLEYEPVLGPTRIEARAADGASASLSAPRGRLTEGRLELSGGVRAVGPDGSLASASLVCDFDRGRIEAPGMIEITVGDEPPLLRRGHATDFLLRSSRNTAAR